MKFNSLLKKTFINLTLLTLLINVIVFVSFYLFLPSAYEANVKKESEIYHNEIVQILEDKNYDQLYKIEGIELEIYDSSKMMEAINPKNIFPKFMIPKGNGFNKRTPNLEVYNLKTNVDNYTISTTRFYDGIKGIRSSIISLSLYLFFITMLISVIFSYIYAKKITSPIKKLTSFTKELAQLNFDYEYDKYDGEDEIKELEDNFVTLTEKLKIVLDELNEDVRNAKLKEEMRRKSIATFSHELKTPLTILKGYNDIILDSIGNPKEYKKYIKENNKILIEIESLIDEILLNAKIDDENYKVKKEEIILNETLNNIITKFGKRINLENKRIIKFKTDQIIIHHVLKNLIENAINHSPNDSIVDISLTNNYLTITNLISKDNTFNTGIGQTIINNGTKKLKLNYEVIETKNKYTVKIKLK